MLEQIISFLKDSTPKVFVGVMLAAAFVIFFPEKYLGFVGLLQFKKDYSVYLGGAFLISLVMTIINIYEISYKNYKVKMERKNLVKHKLKYLETLTPDEKRYLIGYIEQSLSTQNFSIEDGIAGGLAMRGIIFPSAQAYNFSDGMAFNLDDDVRRRLEERPHLLQGAADRIKGSVRQQTSPWRK